MAVNLGGGGDHVGDWWGPLGRRGKVDGSTNSRNRGGLWGGPGNIHLGCVGSQFIGGKKPARPPRERTYKFSKRKKLTCVRPRTNNNPEWGVPKKLQ